MECWTHSCKQSSPDFLVEPGIIMRACLSSPHLNRLASSHWLQFVHKRSQSRSLNIFSIFSKEAVEKERSRLKDELNRGYFDDYRDLKKHAGKLAIASQSLLPIEASIQFPPLKVNLIDGEQRFLPLGQKPLDEDVKISTSPHVTLVCLTFRANGQGLVKSWIAPFINCFKTVSNVRIYEVFYVDSWFLSLAPVRWLLLQAMNSSKSLDEEETMKQVFYAFGDSYEFRKALHITNLLTGYIFLIDKHGRIRWQAFGQSSDQEISSMVSCTSKLLEEQKEDV